MLLSLALSSTQGCLFLEVLILTRWLGPEQYGVLSFALSVQSYLFLFSGTGLRPITVREGVQNPDRLDLVVTSYLVLAATVSGALALLSFSVLALVPLESRERLVLGLFAVANIACATSLVPLFDVHHQQLRSSMISLFVEIEAVMLLVGLYQVGHLNLGTAATVFAIKWTTTMGAHFWAYDRGIRPVQLVLNAGHTRGMFRGSSALMFSALVATVPFQAGVLVVRWFCDAASVALLGLAQQAAAAYLVFSVLGIRVVQPHLAAPQGLSARFLRRLMLLYLLSASLLWLGSMGLGAMLLCCLLDSRYGAALNPMLFLLTAAFVNSVGGLASARLIMRREEGAVLKANLLGALFYVGAAGLVIPRFGPTGAASLATAATGLAATRLWLRLICENKCNPLLRQWFAFDADRRNGRRAPYDSFETD